ncbi:MAG: DinB family protein [Acidimicrobiales bacterium]
MAEQLFSRLEGLGDEEYLWEPGPNCWSVRKLDNGDVAVERAESREITPAPLTTIAWRLWHLAVDCFEDYTRRLNGDGRDVEPDTGWHMEADAGVAHLQQSWAGYRATIAARDDWWDELGEAWGPWNQHSVTDMALHAGNELVHHGAEIALLRDLYVSKPS